MKARSCLQVLGAALAFLPAWCVSAANIDSPVVSRVPVIAVHQGRKVTAEELSAAGQGLGAPALDAADLRRALGLAPPAAPGFADEAGRQFAQAEDTFYEGLYEKAGQAYKTLIDKLEKNILELGYTPSLRAIAFRARLKLAMIANSNRDQKEVSSQLKAAAAYLDIEPSAIDFPPWICEKLKALRAGLVLPPGKLTLSRRCLVRIDGRSYGEVTEVMGLTQGEHAVALTCSSLADPLRVVNIGDKPALLAPLRGAVLDFVKGGQGAHFSLPGGTRTDQGLRALASLGQGVNWSRIVALVGQPGRLELALLDTATGVVLWRNARAAEGPEVAAALAQELMQGSPGSSATAKRQPRKWYRDGLAWTMLAVGLAASGAGAATRIRYGKPSHQEPLAWSLIGGGASCALAGAALFLLQPLEEQEEGGVHSVSAWGFHAAVTF